MLGQGCLIFHHFHLIQQSYTRMPCAQSRNTTYPCLSRELQSCCMHSTVLNLDSKMKSCIRASSVDVSPLLLYLFQHHANHGLFSNADSDIKGIWLQCHFSHLIPNPPFFALHGIDMHAIDMHAIFYLFFVQLCNCLLLHSEYIWLKTQCRLGYRWRELESCQQGRFSTISLFCSRQMGSLGSCALSMAGWGGGKCDLVWLDLETLQAAVREVEWEASVWPHDCNRVHCLRK